MTENELLADIGLVKSHSVNDPSVSAHGNIPNLLLNHELCYPEVSGFSRLPFVEWESSTI